MRYYKMMKERIDMLEQSMNTVDYPDEMVTAQKFFKPNTYWTFGYLNRLVNKSMSGARSPKALSHLKKVFHTIYIELNVLVGIPLVIALIYALRVLFVRK